MFADFVLADQEIILEDYDVLDVEDDEVVQDVSYAAVVDRNYTVGDGVTNGGNSGGVVEGVVQAIVAADPGTVMRMFEAFGFSRMVRFKFIM
jgi:hypothetical protein